MRSLSACKIKTSKDLYNLIETTGEAEAICASTGIGKSELDELHALCNLVRINGVGAAAARTLYESGYKDMAEIALAGARDLLERMTKTNTTGHYYNARLGLKDAQFIIDFAKLFIHFSGANTAHFAAER